MRRSGVVICGIVVSLGIMVFSASGVFAQEDAYAKGLRAYFKKDYAAAVNYLKEYVARKPEAKAYYFLGYAQYELKRKTGNPRGRKDFWADTESAKYFREAYLIDPEFSPKAVGFVKKKK
jgi:tetratricopeptide (TPR) repeat protein